jgi:hypothetical protein
VTSFPALDVALGLSFTYFLFSVVSTTVTETISRFMKQRARMLEKWIGDVLSNPNPGAEATDLVGDFYKTPIMRVLHISTGSDTKQAGLSAKLHLPSPKAPSYMPSTHFIAALLHTGRDTRGAAETSKQAWVSIGHDLERLKGTPAGDALLDIYGGAGGDAARFRKDAEAWFDDQMERLSGVYKRWSTWFVWGISLVIVAALNANTLRMAETLWNDPSARATLVAQAGHTSDGLNADQALTAIHGVPLPLGWDHSGYSGFWSWVLAAFGTLLTLGAISLGAPFWFDTLSRLARIRQTGTPPPASDATRSGEGDQTRTLPKNG